MKKIIIIQPCLNIFFLQKLKILFLLKLPNWGNFKLVLYGEKLNRLQYFLYLPIPNRYGYKTI
jgi:hypothetical protein